MHGACRDLSLLVRDLEGPMPSSLAFFQLIRVQHPVMTYSFVKKLQIDLDVVGRDLI